uniref:PPP2R1A n=1 Tax=Heterorhabditis bacteriophora TaxID=37862 RepID=A0A1I7WZV3_HETBA
MGEVDEECAPPSAGLDWEKLFKMAEDPDIEDILRGPLETAIFHLEDGKEVQKLAAIRSLPDLLEREGQECLEKLLPVIQKVLKKEKSNLDIHCEAAIVFKGVLQNEKLCDRFP